MKSLPLGMRASFTVYMVSVGSGLEDAVTVCDGTKIPENLDPLVDYAISSVGEAAGISDFRRMTDEEIAIYIKAKKAEESTV